MELYYEDPNIDTLPHTYSQKGLAMITIWAGYPDRIVTSHSQLLFNDSSAYILELCMSWEGGETERDTHRKVSIIALEVTLNSRTLFTF